MNFDISKIRGLIDRSKQESAASGNNNKRTKLTYLSFGKHTVRFFLDPEGEVLRNVNNHKIEKNRVLCPRLHRVDGYDKCDICQIAWDIDDWQSGLGVRKEVIIYMYVIATDVKSDYFKPGEWYAVVCKTKFERAFMSYLDSLATHAPQVLAESLDHTKATAPVIIEYTKGAQGICSLAPMPYGEKAPALELDDTWKPLSTILLSNEFDAEKYAEMLKEAQEIDAEYAEKEAKIAAAAAATGDASAQPASETPADQAQAQTPAEQQPAEGSTGTQSE